MRLATVSHTAVRASPCIRASRTAIVGLPQSRPLRHVRVQASKDGNLSEDEGNVGDFCTIENGRRVKKTIGEMEQDFLGALSAWYYGGKPTMSDAEFEVLKEELQWAGSKVATLDSDELRFLEASQAYAKGQTIMSDEEYDTLKASLKQKASVISAEGPRCSIRSKKMYADAETDYLRMTLLNVPAAMIVLGLSFAVDYVTDFAITKAITGSAYGIALAAGLILPSTFVLSVGVTNILFKDNLILKGQCPSCGAENFTYFGEVFSVNGNKGQNAVDCCNCGAGLTFDEYKRIVVVDETAEEKQKKAAALAAKKAASAAKKKARAPAAAAASDE